MTYDYLRVGTGRFAAAASHKPYDEALLDIQRAFVDAVGEGLFDYITTLHKRIGNRPPWSEVSGLNSWDYGSVRSSAKNLHAIRVYQKDISVYPGDIDPVIEVEVEFLSPSVGVLARAGGVKLYLKQHKLDTSPSQVALQIGAAWEKLLTGSVDYGD